MRTIRDMSKRFKIVLYHLNKICEEWGSCRGISANDAGTLRRIHAQIEALFQARKFEPFDDYIFIPEEEFDNEPQATIMLEEDNKRLRARVSVLEGMVNAVRTIFE